MKTLITIALTVLAVQAYENPVKAEATVKAMAFKAQKIIRVVME